MEPRKLACPTRQIYMYARRSKPKLLVVFFYSIHVNTLFIHALPFLRIFGNLQIYSSKNRLVA